MDPEEEHMPPIHSYSHNFHEKTIDNLSDETYIFINSVNRRVAIERLQRAGTEWKTGRYEDL
jgi:hypothetical protein